jgi:hypothetical protein
VIGLVNCGIASRNGNIIHSKLAFFQVSGFSCTLWQTSFYGMTFEW